MEKTIENMNLVLKAVAVKLDRGEYHDAKTLMNTYRSLLSRLGHLSMNDSFIKDNIETLEKNHHNLNILLTKTETLVPHLIYQSEIKSVDVVTETGNRISSAIRNIKPILKKHSKNSYTSSSGEDWEIKGRPST
jgi:hypothetical protein